jgi:anti-sigma factor RsiW
MGLGARLRRWFGGRREPDALVCQQAVELVTEYFEGALAPADRARFEAHLAACAACTAYLEQMRTTIAALGHLEPGELDPALTAGLVDVYRRYHGTAHAD